MDGTDSSYRCIRGISGGRMKREEKEKSGEEPKKGRRILSKGKGAPENEKERLENAHHEKWRRFFDKICGFKKSSL